MLLELLQSIIVTCTVHMQSLFTLITPHHECSQLTSLGLLAQAAVMG